MLSAQQPSPYVPVEHWATLYLEHLIAPGAIRDPGPLTRPFVQADVVRMLSEVDTTRLNAPEHEVARAILSALGRPGVAPKP